MARCPLTSWCPAILSPPASGQPLISAGVITVLVAPAAGPWIGPAACITETDQVRVEKPALTLP